MVKDIRYIIKRIIIGVVIGICMYFFRDYLFMNCYAATLDGSDVSSPNWAVASNYNNSALNIYMDDIYPGLNTWDYSFVIDKNVYLTGCSDMKSLGYSFASFYNGTTGTYATASGIKYVANLTDKSCTFNNGYKGKVIYIKFQLVSELLNVPIGSSSTTVLYNNPLTLRIGSSEAFSFTLQNVIATNDNLDIFSSDFSTKLLESQNNTMIDQNNQIIAGQNNINNSINDDTGGDVPSSWFDNFKDNSSSPISDLITMPITLLQSYMNGFNSDCSSVNLGNLYGTDIILPCIDIENYLGSNLWGLIDSLFTIFMVYNIGMLCVSIYEGITSLDDDMQILYSPRHAASGRVARGEQEGLY